MQSTEEIAKTMDRERPGWWLLFVEVKRKGCPGESHQIQTKNVILCNMDLPPDSEVRNLIRQLQHPVSDFSTLLSLLAAPLDSLSILPPIYRSYNVNPLPSGSTRVSVHVPLLQRALLQHILPTWDSDLNEQKCLLLVDQYFCPDLFSFASLAAGDIALLAYSTILSLPLTDYSIRLLVRLSKEYPIDRLHSSVFSQKDSLIKLNRKWEDCIQNVVAIPAKVGNYCGIKGLDIPPLLMEGKYFDSLSVRCESLISTSNQGKHLVVHIHPIYSL